MRKIVMMMGTAAIVGLTAGPATAHVTVQPNEGIAGGFSTFFVQVPNERDDASTTKIEVQFPEVFASVSFQPVDGWEREVEMVEFDEPVEAFGEEVTEGVGTVTWSGGRIAPGEFERFAFSVGPVPEGEMEFRAIQTYSSGEVVRWIGPSDAEEPAARVQGIDLGLEQGQGQLSALAELGSGGAAGDGATSTEDDSGSGDDDDGDALPIILSAIGAGLGGLALVVALTRKDVDTR
jgi:uncharacterized protein YcnI